MVNCYYHPERPGIGICVRCREILCSGCITRLDGINHCHTCLEELANRPVPVDVVSPPLQITVFLVANIGLLFIIWLASGTLAPSDPRPIQEGRIPSNQSD